MGIVREAGGLDALLDRAAERYETSNRKLLGEFLDQADKKSEARVQQMEATLRSEFSAATNAIREEVAMLSKTVGGLKSMGTPPRPQDDNGNFRQLRQEIKDFQPSKVELKGWVSDWDKRYEQGLTKPEAAQCLDHLIQ